MKMKMEDRTYFTPGETVILKQEIPHKPVMIVKTIDKAETPDYVGNKADKLTERSNKPVFLGVTCFWFTAIGEYQSQRFNTKDLEHHYE